MLIKLILIIFMSILLAYIVNNIDILNKKNDKISFRESMDLTELPIITLYNGNTKINFLLDTGSNNSHINKSFLCNLEYEETEEVRDVVGMEGNTISNNTCNIVVHYKDKEYKENFVISDLDNAFNVVKEENGVQLHGILGSRFFEKYSYVLDFADLVAYSK